MYARQLAKLLGTFHNVSYYAPEMKAFADVGLREYWRAYMAYRSAPLGIVPPSVVESLFYNFAPDRVAAGLPSAWDTTTPADAIALRDRSISTALTRAFEGFDMSPVVRAAEIALPPITQVEAGMRPLFAAHRELEIPEDPLMKLWYAATLWREHRGDGHNIALAAAEIDGTECHILLAAKGVGDQETITKIRGWSKEDWQQAGLRMMRRKLVVSSGKFTPDGQQLRADIEDHTDELASPPRDLLGEAGCKELVELLEPLVGQLITSGTVPGRWPPKQTPS